MSWRDRFAALLGAQQGARIDASYVIRLTLAATAARELTHALGIAEPIWAIVSAIVVIFPEVKASVASAALRVVANLIGAGVGIAIAELGVPGLPALLVGLVAVAGLCRAAGLDGASRTATSALVIVLLRGGGDATVVSSEVRVGLVVMGCACALAVTIAVDRAGWLWRRLRRPT
jgi:uncharacterized membrane protein YgaE (UPF0421/DUF939 family)